MYKATIYKQINVYLKQCCLSIYFVNLRCYHNKRDSQNNNDHSMGKISLCIGNICVIENHRHIHGIVARDSF